jgi:hypothetical protein
MILFYIGPANWLAGILLSAAFILTFWRRRPSWWLAAGFYSVGTLFSIGVKVYFWLLSVWLVYGLSYSGDGNVLALAGMALTLPIFVSVYWLASVVLLLPWIPQKYAICFGKILHLVIFPIFFLVILITEFIGHPRQASLDLQWLIYGPLWFRIREIW